MQKGSDGGEGQELHGVIRRWGPGAFQGPPGLHFLLKMLSGELAFTIIKACYELPEKSATFSQTN